MYIAVCDDVCAHREAAASAIAEVLPLATVKVFCSAQEIIAELRNHRGQGMDLILTDLNMEEWYAGYRVACEAWAWNIPAIIVSGGHKTHGRDQVAVGFPHTAIDGDKDNPAVWKRVLELVLGNVMISMVIARGKKRVADYEYGAACAGAMMCGIPK